MGKRLRSKNDRGASLVEFALIMPLLVLLIFGMVDAGWAFFQNLEVRHGARELARMAVVDLDPGGPGATQEERLIEEMCARLVADGSVWAAASRNGDDIGDTVTVLVVRDHTALTSFLPFFDSIQLRSIVEMRLEQPSPGWSDIPAGGVDINNIAANLVNAGVQTCP